MILLLLLLGLSASESSGLLLKASALLSPQTHALCLSLMPHDSAQALRSLICGAPILDADLKQLLRQNGLLHLFVVSGAHLVWLDSWLAKLKVGLYPRIFGWTLFSLACGWQAPVVRAWISLLLVSVQDRWTPRPRGDQRVLVAGLVTLTLFPSWGDSLSLALSWIAAFSLSLPYPKGWRGELTKCFSVWFFMLPLLVPWSPASPLTILINFLLAPLFSLVLMPLGILSVVAPFTVGLFDFAFSLFADILRQIPTEGAAAAVGNVPPPWLCWAWIAFLHLITHAYMVRKKRAGT